MEMEHILSRECLSADFLSPYAAANLNDNQRFLPKDVQSALERVLASQEFCKAQRTSRLLRFLVEKALADDVRETSEYAIGIAVFDRDSATYSTGDDPIVRVQIGRLREKLRAYYAAVGANTDLKFYIPVGSYMPVIEHTAIPQLPFLHNRLAVAPLLHFSKDPDAAGFTHGLNEELMFQLFSKFGPKVLSHSLAATPAVTPRGIQHLLEGSIRVDGELIRASLRLTDVGVGCIAWSEQFDCRRPLGISIQEQLSTAICSALQQYFSYD